MFVELETYLADVRTEERRRSTLKKEDPTKMGGENEDPTKMVGEKSRTSHAKP